MKYLNDIEVYWCGTMGDLDIREVDCTYKPLKGEHFLSLHSKKLRKKVGYVFYALVYISTFNM